MEIFQTVSLTQKLKGRTKERERTQTATETATVILMVLLKRYHSGKAMTKYL